MDSRVNAQLAPARERIAKIEGELLPPTVPALLAAAVEDCPERVALNFIETGNTLTYAELARVSDALAAGLASIAIGKGTHVGVLMPNIAEFPITWLAIGKLGAVMVPINTRYTATELAYVLTDADCEVLIVHESFLPVFETIRPDHPALKVVTLGSGRPDDASWAALSEAPGRAPDVSLHGEDILNIQYTSGTTGLPKGCVLTHRYWMVYGVAHARRDDVTLERLFTAAPFFYLDAMWMFVASLVLRATLHVARRYSLTHYMTWLRDHRINYALMPDALLTQSPSPDDRCHELVRVVVPGIRKAVHRQYEQRFGVIARESYGMTEIGPGLYVPIEADLLTGSGSCGIPLPFRRFRIADPQGVPVAPGETGELLVTGPGIFEGYYKKPEANAVSFHGEWFRTGDLFRQDEAGCFYLVGRVKDVIRRAGENVAAQEVEAVLLECAEIAEAAVVPVPDPLRGEEVKACIVLRQNLAEADLPAARILDHCRQKLAPFKVPRYLEYRREPLPRTASGKVAKQALIAEVSGHSQVYDLAARP